MHAGQRLADIDVSGHGERRGTKMLDKLPISRMLFEPLLNARGFFGWAFAGEKARDAVPIGSARERLRGARAVVGHALSTRKEMSTLSRIMDRSMEYTGTPSLGTDAEPSRRRRRPP